MQRARDHGHQGHPLQEGEDNPVHHHLHGDTHLPTSTLTDVPEPRYVKDAMSQLMPGCIVNASAPFLEYATERVLDLLGVSTERYEGGCCTSS